MRCTWYTSPCPTPLPAEDRHLNVVRRDLPLRPVHEFSDHRGWSCVVASSSRPAGAGRRHSHSRGPSRTPILAGTPLPFAPAVRGPAHVHGGRGRHAHCPGLLPGPVRPLRPGPVAVDLLG